MKISVIVCVIFLLIETCLSRRVENSALKSKVAFTPKGILCKVTQQRDQCGYLGWLLDCRHLNFQRIPLDFNTMVKGKAIAIDLSSNDFTSISPETFAGINTTLLRNVTALYLKNNDIKYIDGFSFRLLSRLCVLDLSSCNLRVHAPRKCAFSYLTKLEILYIQGNEFYKESHNYSYPEGELSRLSSLKELHIDVFEGFRFRGNFKSLKHLNKLTLYPTKSLFHLYNDTFSGLSASPIYNISMMFRNHVRCDVSEDIFCSFPFLKRVFMSFGGLCDLNVVLDTLKCLQNRTIEKISAISNFPALITHPTFLNKSNCKYILNICAKAVDLSYNRITGIAVRFLESTLGRCIEYFDISHNHITYYEASFLVDFLQNYPNLQYIDVSYNAEITRGMINVSFPGNFILNPNITIIISKVLKVIRYSNNHIHKIPNSAHFQFTIVGEALKELDFSKTNFPFDRIMQLRLPHLETLDISDNKCSIMSFRMLKTLAKLKLLRASNTNFNFITDPNWRTLLEGLKNLHLLDLRNNFIHHLPSTIFKEQTNLHTLYLTDNSLSFIPTAVTHLRNLTHLYINNNIIKSLKSSDFHILQSLTKAKTFIKGNLLDCDCSHISMLRWMRDNQNLFGDLNETYCVEYALNFSELLTVRRFSVFEKKCQTGAWLIGSSFMLFFATIGMVVAIAIKRYRVHVDYIILRLRSRWKGVMKSDENETFQFDAFISYSEDDYQLVCITMYQALTNLGFQISFSEKDFVPGVHKAEQIIQYIDKSRKVVFVITENFLDNGWNSYAVQMAVTHAFHNNRKRSIIAIIKDNISLERMPKDLRYIWWCINSMRWPEGEEVQVMDSFWENIATALRSP